MVAITLQQPQHVAGSGSLHCTQRLHTAALSQQSFCPCFPHSWHRLFSDYIWRSPSFFAFAALEPHSLPQLLLHKPALTAEHTHHLHYMHPTLLMDSPV